jgi:5'-methylthioadenosine phosphorylase
MRIGIIGGSGLYEMAALINTRERAVETPFGQPSDAYICGTLMGVDVAFLPRHGRGHRLLPSELNYRANIHGLKSLGVDQILSVTAVGSLKEHIRPTDIVVPDQFYDRTRQRASTFFGNGVAAHIAFADPVCPRLSRLLLAACRSAGARVHAGGTLVCIEGPAFSTRAETEVYRRLGMDVVGMTTLQEAKLAREAEICYAPLALVTDYDSWHTSEADVTVDTVVTNLNRGLTAAGSIIAATVSRLSRERACGCGSALDGAVMTDPGAISQTAREKLAVILEKYLSNSAAGPD